MIVFEFVLIWVSFYNKLIEDVFNLPNSFEVIPIIVLVIYFLLVAYKQKLRISNRIIILLSFSLFIYLMYNMIIWQPFFHILYGMRFLYIPLLIGILVTCKSDYNNLNRLFDFILKIINIQTFAVLLHGIYNLVTGRYLGDNVYGLIGFGGANIIGFLIVIQGAYYFNRLLIMENKIKNGVMVLVSIIAPLLAEAKTAILALLVAIIIINLSKNINIKRRVFVSFVLLILVVFSQQLMDIYVNITHLRAFDLINTIKAEYGSTSYIGAAARTKHFVYAFNVLLDNAPCILLGVGIGTYESAAGLFFNAPLAQQKQYFFDSLANRTVVTHTQFTTTLVETGFFGVLLVQGLFLLMFLQSNIVTNNKETIIKVNTVRSAIIILFVSQISCNILDYQYVMIPFYFLFFIVIRMKDLTEAVN